MSSVRLLRTFIAVAQEGSFAAAAQKVALTQAAVGQQMRSLEEELHRPLFERDGKTVQLNQAGRELLPQARQMVALYTQMQAGGLAGDAMAGTLHLGAVVSALRPLLLATLELKRRYAGLDLHVGAAKSGDLVARVAAGELDAAIVVHQPGEERTRADLVWTPLYTEPMVLLVPRRKREQASPAQDEDVRRVVQTQPFIRFDRSEHTGQLVDRTLRRLRATPQEFLELNAIETMVELVRAGLGVTLLPQLRAGRWATDPKLRLVPLGEAAEVRQVMLVQPRASTKASLIGAVSEAFARHVAP